MSFYEITADIDPFTCGPMLAFALAADDTHVYYTTNYSTGTAPRSLMRVATTEGTVPER